jgi:hypothetical protein
MGKFWWTESTPGGAGARRVHHGPGTDAWWGLTGARPIGRSSSPELVSSGQGRRQRRVEAEGVLTGARAAAERQCDNSGERWRRELNAGAEEGMKVLAPGCALPFIGAGDAVARR